MKLALVHDDLIQFGGAEKLLLAMHEIWPEAPLYTSMASSEWVKRCCDAKVELRTSFMQYLPFKKHLYKAYFPLYPLAFESFKFDEFDVVLSSSARFAHGVVTKPKTKHICYMNTPGRMWWEASNYFAGKKWLQILLAPLLGYLRMWDYAVAQRVDVFVANSKTPQARIKKYFSRDSDVVYPFAELLADRKSKIKDQSQTQKPKLRFGAGYFLVVTRLASWKRVDIAIEACKDLGLNLVVVGTGPDEGRLRRWIGNCSNIFFAGSVSDEDLASFYKGCQAVIITQEEDFGIVAVEAASFERPVVAFGAGGSLEIVKSGVTGEFFYPQSADALVKVMRSFDSRNYHNFDEVVGRFSRVKFVEGIWRIVVEDRAPEVEN